LFSTVAVNEDRRDEAVLLQEGREEMVSFC
jgi:hypothetical protein